MPKIIEFIKASYNEKLFSDNVRRAMIINLFSFIGLLTLIYFIIGGLIHKNYIYSLFLILFLILIILNLYILHKKHYIQLSSHVLTLIQLVLNSTLIFFVGTNSGSIFWAYLIPILSAFLVGRKGLLLYASIQLIFVVLAFKTNLAAFNYPNEIFERLVLSYIVVSFIIYTFEYTREKTWQAFLIADKEKSEYLEEVLMQKEEIQAQAELLEEKNKKLELLSIVASETDNAIIIADAQGNFEWVNNKFIDLYGKNIEFFTNQNLNIFDLSNNYQELKKILTSQKSITYTNLSVDKNGINFWVQTTVSPYFENNLLKKIIILDTDITQLKLYEQKIAEQNEELKQQTEEILAQKEELEAKNEQITAKNEAIALSLKYAATIQKVIMPDLEAISQKFDNFLVYLPKDIVSGDFYWYEQTQDYSFFAVVDCTGHGVPAAFLTILGARILTEIVKNENLLNPNQILKSLDNKIYNALKHSSSDANEGMDIILVRSKHLENNTFEIVYSGAKRYLLYYEVENKRIIRDKMFHATIAGNKINNFEQRTINLSKNSIIYLTTDGFTDQQNKDMKKIGSKQLLQLLQTNINLPLNNQKEILLNYFKNWKDDFMQIDDVTIWGVKL